MVDLPALIGPLRRTITVVSTPIQTSLSTLMVSPDRASRCTAPVAPGAGGT